MDRPVPRTLIATLATVLGALATAGTTAAGTTTAGATAGTARLSDARAEAEPSWPPANLALIHSARFWEAHERGDLAELAWKKLVAARPDSPDALLELGELELRINNFSSAAEVASELASRFKGSAAAHAFAVEYRVATHYRLKFASIRRLVEVGRTGEVRAALARLFPDGPPSGSLGLEYYALLASAPDGAASAYQGVRRLAARHPDDPRYQLALARLMLRQHETELEGLKLLERLAQRDDIHKADVDALLSAGLLKRGPESAPPAQIDAYLARHPGDTKMLALRAARRQALAERALLAPENLDAVIPELQGRLAHALSAVAGADPPARAEARAWLERSVSSSARRDQRRAALELRAALAFSRAQYEAEIGIAQDLDSIGSPTEAGELIASAARLDPTSTWLFETEIRWLSSHGRSREAIDLLEGRPLDRKWTRAARDALLASALAQRAAQESRAGESEAAIKDLEAAVRLAPRDPWTRYRLAGLYQARHEPDHGRQVMIEGVSLAPDDPTMRYAQALYLSSLDDGEAAFAAIDAIDPVRRSAEMGALHDRLQVARARASARRLKEAGDLAGARAALIEAEPIAAHGIERAAELAYSWIELGDSAHGIALVEPYVMHGARDAKSLLLFAHVLNSAEEDTRLGPVLSQLLARADLDDAAHADVLRLERELDLRTVRALIREHRYAEATRRLDALLAGAPQDRSLRVARADLELAAGRPRAARDLYAALVAEDPEDLDTRLSYVRALTDSGDLALARTQLSAVEARMPPTGDELHISLARRELALGEAEKALRTLAPLLAATPVRTDVLMLAGHAQLAQRHFAQARSYFDRAARRATGEEARSARRELDALDERLESTLTAGVIARHQPGTAGLSQLDTLTIPSSWLIARDYESRFTAHADAVYLDSGRWSGDPDSPNLLGTIPLARAGTVLREQQTGVSPALGYRTDSIAVDLGTTPLGFVLTNVIGGLEWTPTWHGADLTLGVSRRAITSSELSYAGLKDPLTGIAWGGAVQTGPYAGFGVYRAAYDVSGTVQLTEITGTHVLDNQFAGARLSASLKIAGQEDLRADAGLSLNYWNYQHNLSNYSFGSGGYYSPQSYVSLATPVTLDVKRAGWALRLRGAVSYSVSEVRAIAFFPNDSALQAAAMRSPLPDGFSSPYYPGYHSSGFGFTAYAAGEHPVTSWLVGGFLIDIDRTDYYHPTTVELYVRHAFGARTTRTLAPPSPVYPYNR